MAETPPGKRVVEIQRAEHESRVHIDIETDDIAAEVAHLEKEIGCKSVGRPPRWLVMPAPTGWRFCVVHVQPWIPEERQSVG